MATFNINADNGLAFYFSTFLRVLQTSSANPGTIGDCFLIKVSSCLFVLKFLDQCKLF